MTLSAQLRLTQSQTSKCTMCAAGHVIHDVEISCVSAPPEKKSSRCSSFSLTTDATQLKQQPIQNEFCSRSTGNKSIFTEPNP